MIRWIASPDSAKVSKYIESYWYFEKQSAGEGFDYPKLNPDPSGHLVIYPTDHYYKYTFSSGEYQGQGTHFIYPHSEIAELDHSTCFKCFGVKFRVGSLYSLNSINFSRDLINSVRAFNYDALIKSCRLSEAAIIAVAKNGADSSVKLFDEIFSDLLLDCYEDKQSELVRKIMPLLPNTAINDLSSLVSYSQRTLERSFLKVTGFTLKQCQSIQKLEMILEYLYQCNPGDVDWADLACQFGFSDQPHLIRYLKKYIHLTPKNYREQGGLTIDVYGYGD
ncbi:helix-turn-helix domain-containing protein [Rheinheimera gaetbuli]